MAKPWPEKAMLIYNLRVANLSQPIAHKAINTSSVPCMPAKPCLFKEPVRVFNSTAGIEFVCPSSSDYSPSAMIVKTVSAANKITNCLAIVGWLFLFLPFKTEACVVLMKRPKYRQTTEASNYEPLFLPSALILGVNWNGKHHPFPTWRSSCKQRHRLLIGQTKDRVSIYRYSWGHHKNMKKRSRGHLLQNPTACTFSTGVFLPRYYLFLSQGLNWNGKHGHGG